MLTSMSASEDVWDGASYLQTTAAEANVVLDAESTFDWRAATLDSIIFALEPVDGAFTDNLLRFIDDGGHAVIALDQGHNASMLLREFGLQVHNSNLDHDRFYEDHPAFPVLSPPEDQEEHFLWFNVQEVVGNHPLVLRPLQPSYNDITPLVWYRNPSDWFAVEIKRKRGSAIIVADSSIFINDMQRHLYGDKQFVANLYRYYCDSSESCRVNLILPNTNAVGGWQVAVPNGLAGLEYLFSRGLDTIQSGIDAATEQLNRPESLRTLSYALALLIPVLLLALPYSARRTPFMWSKKLHNESSMNDFWVAALSRNSSGATFARPVIAILNDFERIAQKHLHTFKSEGLGDTERRRIASELAREAGQPIDAAALRCLNALHKVRQATTKDRLPHVAVKEFEDLWTNYITVKNALSKRLM